MEPVFDAGNVKAPCPTCSAVTTFEFHLNGNQFGEISFGSPQGAFTYQGRNYGLTTYKLLKCAGCRGPGIAKVYNDSGKYPIGKMEWFYPSVVQSLPLPPSVPQGIQNEFKEAEVCANAGAWRASSAMLRSTLEKILIDNGYEGNNLAQRIDQAATDNLITGARRQRAHEDIRVLGNDVLHEEWRNVSEEEFHLAHHYVQRIAEDFYDDRPTVEKALRSIGRVPPVPDN